MLVASLASMSPQSPSTIPTSQLLTLHALPLSLSALLYAATASAIACVVCPEKYHHCWQDTGSGQPLTDDQVQKLLECDGPFLLMPHERFYKYAQENFPPTMLETRYDTEYEDWVIYVTQQDVKVLRTMYCNPLATSHGVASNSCSTIASLKSPISHM